jgi:hypothetical protein
VWTQPGASPWLLLAVGPVVGEALLARGGPPPPVPLLLRRAVAATWGWGTGAEGFRAVSVNLLRDGASEVQLSGALRAEDQVVVRGVAAIKAALAGIGGE